MVEDLLEDCGLEHAQESSVVLDVPDNAGTVGADGDSLGVILSDLD